MDKQDIEKLLAEGRIIQFKPQGYSMYPLFVPGRDEAIVAPAEVSKLRRGDVVLYRRDGSILVLHRIWKRKGDQFYLVGDNQTEIEGPLRPDQMKGILIGLRRNGRHISTKNVIYRTLLNIWLFLRPLRPAISGVAAAAKRMFKVLFYFRRE
ncbi:MAG: S24/S26 family peptidase [Acetatifactor sp.]|nr:S24/S26 family peptidase [Acetatifactor sp.]